VLIQTALIQTVLIQTVLGVGCRLAEVNKDVEAVET